MMYTTPKTFGEAMDRILVLQDKITVYEEMVDYLVPFISTDSHIPAKGVKSARPDEPVEEGLIIEVQSELKDVISSMKKEIDKLRGMGLSGRAEKVPVKKVTKKAPPKRRNKK